MADPGQNAILAKVAEILREVDGVQKVETEPGGVVSWAIDARPGRSFWELDLPRIGEGGVTTGSGPGGTYKADYSVVLEGWMPWSRDEKSASKWRTLTDLVRAKFRGERGLRGLAKDVGLPQTRESDYETFEGGLQKPTKVLCHHARIELRVSVHGVYSTR